MGYKEFKEFVFSTEPSKMVFQLYKHGLSISSPVLNVRPYHDNAGIIIYFEGGNFHVWKENKIFQAYLIIECEICFSFYNEFEEHIGYLYIPRQV